MNGYLHTCKLLRSTRLRVGSWRLNRNFLVCIILHLHTIMITAIILLIIYKKGHSESYNPPEEYLFSPEEEKEWSELGKKGRRQNYMPTKFKSYRDIKQWPGLLRQTYER